MTLWWRCNVYNVGFGFIEEFAQDVERSSDRKSFRKLFGHQGFSIIDADNLASLNPADLRRVRDVLNAVSRARPLPR